MFNCYSVVSTILMA